MVHMHVSYIYISIYLFKHPSLQYRNTVCHEWFTQNTRNEPYAAIYEFVQHCHKTMAGSESANVPTAEDSGAVSKPVEAAGTGAETATLLGSMLPSGTEPKESKEPRTR